MRRPRATHALLAVAVALAVGAHALPGRTLAASRPLPPDTAQASGYMPVGDAGARLFYMLQDSDGGVK